MIISIEKLNPFILTPCFNVACLVMTPNLKVSSIFAETHAKLTFFDKLLLKHSLVYRLEAIQILTRNFTRET